LTVIEVFRKQYWWWSLYTARYNTK